MSHTHQWRVTQYCLLGLPREGLSERCIAWRCQSCPALCVMTGDLRVGTPLYWPEFWDQVQRSPAYQRIPEARMAAQQDRWRIR